MPTTILTGYNGLLGKSVLADLAEAGDVICIGRSAPPPHKRITFVQASLSDAQFVRQLPQQADQVIHLAQADGFQAFPAEAAEVFKVNVASVSQLLDWACGAGVKTFVHASTGGLYGTADLAFTETDPVRIEGRLANYLTTKYCAELLANSYRSQFSIVTLRYFFIYGPSQKPQMLLPRLIDSVRAGRQIEMNGENGILLNPVFVTDAAKATIEAAKLSRSAIYNIGGTEIFSLREIVETIGLNEGKQPRIRVNPLTSSGGMLGNIDLMRKDLHVPVVSFSEGLARMCKTPVV